MSKDRPRNEEIVELVERVCQGELSVEQAARLETLLQTDKAARRYYVRYLHLHASLPLFSDHESGERDLARLQESLGSTECDTRGGDTAGDQPSESTSRDSSSASPSVLSFIGDCFQQGSSFLTRPQVFSLLVAVGLPGIVLLTLAVSLVHQSRIAPPQPVARIVRTHGCDGYLGNGHVRLCTGMNLVEGQRLTLKSGLVELEFGEGARAILEAPSAFEVRGGNAGYLQMGRLSANVPRRAHGFAVETPLLTVVDLGTEFGVSVAADGVAETHVFGGEIELATKTMPENPSPVTKRLVAGEGARIGMTDSRRTVRIEPIAAVSDDFVRRLPTPVRRRSAPPAPSSPLITSVRRLHGRTGDRAPVGPYDGETAPLPSSKSGLRRGAVYFSDRVYPVNVIDASLVGAEYVRTFNSDKNSPKHTYELTFDTNRDKVFLMVLADDRLEKVPGEQQRMVDSIVSRFARPGQFVNTGCKIMLDDLVEEYTISAFGMFAPTKDESGNPIVYTFSAPSVVDTDKKFIDKFTSGYSIAVLEKAPTSNKRGAPRITP